ncbi:MAG: tetratricopeptide repeat protein, partial [bacterium]|nr:tetratricopeptide repeat protein [bacterium]
MRVNLRPQPLFRVLVLPFLALLALLALINLAACQPVAPKQAPAHPPASKLSQHQIMQPGSTRSNLACSYSYFLRGRNAELRLQFKEALEAYETALRCDSKADYIQDKIPMLLLRLDRADEAAQWLARYLQNNPENVSMRMLYARILLGRQQMGAAMQEYRRILESHPDDPAVILPLAEMQLASGHTDQARSILSKTLQRDPQSYQAHVLMARLLRSESRIEEAKAHYDQALALNWSADLQGEEAELLIQEKDYEQAEAMYRDIIDREEQNETAYLGLIRLLLQQDKDEQALQELLHLRQVADKPLWVDMAIARLYIKQEKNQEAKNLLEQMLNRNSNSEARLLLAVLLQQEKQYEKALRQVRLIDNKALEYPQALSVMIGLYKELNRVDDAVLFLERNIAGPITRHPAMYPLLATLHDSQGRSAMSRK